MVCLDGALRLSSHAISKLSFISFCHTSDISRLGRGSRFKTQEEMYQVNLFRTKALISLKFRDKSWTVAKTLCFIAVNFLTDRDMDLPWNAIKKRKFKNIHGQNTCATTRKLIKQLKCLRTIRKGCSETLTHTFKGRETE